MWLIQNLNSCLGIAKPFLPNVATSREIEHSVQVGQYVVGNLQSCQHCLRTCLFSRPHLCCT